MSIKNRDIANKRAEKHGPYYIIRYPSGGFNVWKKGWRPRGNDVPNPEKVRQRYAEHQEHGKTRKNVIETYIGYYGVLACGKRSIPEGRKFLGLPDLGYHSSEEESRSIVFNYWKPRRKQSGEYYPTQNQDKNITAFMQDHLKAYKYAARNLGGFRKALESWCPGLYSHISQRRASPFQSPKRAVNMRDELSQELIDRHNKGLCISSTGLQNSTDSYERELRRRVMEFGKLDLFKKKEPYTLIVHRLTGIPINDIRMDQGSQVNAGFLTENLTGFLFYWSSILGLNTWSFDTTQWITYKENDLKFKHNGDNYKADLRIGNQAIEVKTAIGRFKAEKEILKKYGHNHAVWSNNEKPVEQGAVIFHAKPILYQHAIQPINEAGLGVIGYDDFHDHLIKVVDQMKKRSSMYRDVQPITNLDYLVALHEEISLHPFLLVRKGNKEKREWFNHILKSLIIRAQELRNKKGVLV